MQTRVKGNSGGGRRRRLVSNLQPCGQLTPYMIDNQQRYQNIILVTQSAAVVIHKKPARVQRAKPQKRPTRPHSQAFNIRISALDIGSKGYLISPCNSSRRMARSSSWVPYCIDILSFLLLACECWWLASIWIGRKSVKTSNLCNHLLIVKLPKDLIEPWTTTTKPSKYREMIAEHKSRGCKSTPSVLFSSQTIN